MRHSDACKSAAQKPVNPEVALGDPCSKCGNVHIMHLFDDNEIRHVMQICPMRSLENRAVTIILRKSRSAASFGRRSSTF